MECERSNIFVLIVDNDDVSLDILANILIAWQYRVITAKTAPDAMQHLRDFDGLFDLIITEVHLPGISGIAFQKHVKDDYQIPVIVMSNDRRESVICKSYEYGAAHYIMKPFCAEDFKDIWKIAMDAKKEKLFIENELIVYDQEGESSGGDDDVNSLNTLNEPKIKKKYCKRKNDEYQDGDFHVVKKPKLVWTTYLHNLFLLAIKQIGLDKAVPKKILEVMNIPNLTRENVASHLQKYRIFLRDVAEKGMIGGISHRALRSRFASCLPVSVIKEIQAIRTNKLRAPTRQYLQKLSYQNGDDNNVLQQFNQVSSNNNAQFSFLQKGLTLEDLDQVRIGKSSFENNDGVIQQNKFGISSSSIPTFHQAKNSYSDGANGFHGLMNSSSSLLTRGLNNYGLRNWNMTSLNNNSNNVLSQKNNIFVPMSNAPFGVQLNNGSEMVATINNNGFGFNVGANNENVNVGGSFGLLQGGFGLDSVSVSDVSGGSGSEVPTKFVNAENVAMQKMNGNVVENVNQNNGAANLISENEFKQMEINVADFLMADDNLNLLNEMDVNRVDATGILNADFNFFQDEQPSEQIYKSGDANFPSAMSSDKKANELRGNEGFFNEEPYNRSMGDKAYSATTSTIGTQELDVDLIEALFGTKEN